MLLKGEKIVFEEEKVGLSTYTDEQINEKYLLGEVRIVTEQARYPLSTISDMFSGPDYNMNPDFQRRHRWDLDKKSRLIESLVMNVPIPPIFLYENELSHYEVMDGLQRLSTICDFYANKFELQNLVLWNELNGRTYSQLPEKVQKGLDRRYISSIILLKESAKDETEAKKMKQLVFERINSGGVKLEPQETRNALFDGPMNDLCIDLSRNEYLCKYLSLPLGDPTNEEVLAELEKYETYNKMEDVQYVLRFFAMRQLDGYAKRALNVFLDCYLEQANKFSSVTIDELRNIFEDTIRLAHELFAEKAFCMFKSLEKDDGIEWKWTKKTAVVIYDPLMQVLSEMLPYKEALLDYGKSHDLIGEMEHLYQENEEEFGGRNNGKSDIESRINIYRTFFKRIVNK